MIDPLRATLVALTSHSPLAFALVFVAGAVTSAGPCAVPRYVALAALAGRGSRAVAPTIAFVVGLCAAFFVLGFGAGMLTTLWSMSTYVYTMLAIALIGSGIVMLVRAAPEGGCEGECARADFAANRPRSLGAFFVLGASSALIISPCCTPVVVAIVATSVQVGKPLTGAFLLLSYAIGHTLPLFFAGTAGAIVRRAGRGRFSAQAPAIAAAVLVLALGAYYAVLA